ncbi:eCIS core domain-containing protein [Aurantiacibacter hainanensis]|uniref:eCIS core domain-containing protein n=1 Tax=Aurantiacibacter hainanensis TaxID=3076114 RepID=UPI0030C77840
MPQETGCIGPPRELALTINQLFTPLMAEAIEHSRASIDRKVLREIPEPVRNRLSSYYAEEELDRVRWVMADEAGGIAGIVAGEATRYKAVTLGNIIVFEGELAARDLGLWAHELLHVRQYEGAGNSRRFARDYLARWSEIERDAVEETNRVLRKLGVYAEQETPSFDRCKAFDEAG